MKRLLILSLFLTGCATVYKVDDKGVCRDIHGKIVNQKDIDPDKHIKALGGLGYGGSGSMFGFVVRLEQLNTGGTAYGW